ncbi:MAG: carbon-nitrogen family hydrolase [Deltaproteobacteria bacterium]|nr:carbon-nitrogen family hydrolase [Deltaproteobacteria bacterium]
MNYTKNQNKKVTAGVVQFDVAPGEISSNLEKAVSGIKSLSRSNADIVLLPELWSCGFDVPNMAGHAGKTPEILLRLKTLAVKYHMLIAGSLPEKNGESLYNTMFLIDSDGSIAGAYRKVHLFVPLCENECFSPGDRLICCNTSIGKIGLAVCYDLRFPEVIRASAIKGAWLVVVSAQWPLVRMGHWDTLLRARAIENQIFVMGANACGVAKSPQFSGHSAIISPSGKIMANAGTRPGHAATEINPDDVSKARKLFSSIYERIPEAYE